jgi:hypothetical protein
MMETGIETEQLLELSVAVKCLVRSKTSGYALDRSSLSLCADTHGPYRLGIVHLSDERSHQVQWLVLFHFLGRG